MRHFKLFLIVISLMGGIAPCFATQEQAGTTWLQNLAFAAQDNSPTRDTYCFVQFVTENAENQFVYYVQDCTTGGEAQVTCVSQQLTPGLCEAGSCSGEPLPSDCTFGTPNTSDM